MHFIYRHSCHLLILNNLNVHFISTRLFLLFTHERWTWSSCFIINPLVKPKMYVIQSIISWIGRIVTPLFTTVDTRNHEMVSCPFFSHPSKKQMHLRGVFRKKITVLKGSCLRAAEIENVAVWATGTCKVLPKIRQIH
jgi:hypothetical protein